ncbi:MAG: DUF452 family protein [Prevotella sp.]|nr:DUF452 family protein [Bacteroides sp.]MCM1366599.1 DUF452 family protein [Prevotella sp.]MCM1437304.1 DUF452 family protein [Prevotella sp.]
MKISRISHTEGNSRVMLIFAGWSTTPAFYASLTQTGWDLIVVYDYSDLSFDNSIMLNYTTVYVYAWSLGVFAAALALSKEDYTAAFAINGTEIPADDHFGIPLQIYQGTLNGLSERNLRKFRRRMTDSSEKFSKMMQKLPETNDIEALRTELSTILSATLAKKPQLDWDRVYISLSDHIIPTDAQKRYWQQRNEIPVVTLDGPHLPDFESIVNSTIPDLSRVGKHFSNALSTYDNHASAQKIIATRLAELIASLNPAKHGKILEFGQGSGLFTRKYAPILTPNEIEYVDLYPTNPLQLAPTERYYTANAELWLPQHLLPQRDFILSSSCLQWFVDPIKFFDSVAQALTPGGIFAFSTFLPGNLSELDAIRPTPLIYPAAEKLHVGLLKHFKRVKMEKLVVPIYFQNIRELLMHLRHTGVKGGMATTKNLREIAQILRNPDTRLYRLTYKALLVTADNPL